MSKSTSTFDGRDQIFSDGAEIPEQDARLTDDVESDDPRYRAPYAPRNNKRPKPEPTPRATPSEGLSTSEAVTWWIDELSESIEYLRAIQLAFVKFSRPRDPSDGGFLTIYPNHLPKRFRDRYRQDVDDSDTVFEYVVNASESLAEAIRVNSPDVGPAQLARFVDPRDGRTWVGLPSGFQLDLNEVTFDLIDRHDDPLAWSPGIDLVAVFPAGRPIRFKVTWLNLNECDHSFAIGEDGTATLVEAED